MNGYCIDAYDTNITLEATFRFIYENQFLTNGGFVITNIYLGIASIKNLDFDNYSDRKLVFNIISGKIVEVKETYCKIETSSLCEDENQVYTVAYNNISNVISNVLINYSDKYLDYMNCLPNICSYPSDKYSNLLSNLEEALFDMTETQVLSIIYSGIFSLQYKKADLKILSNLIYIEKDAIVPVTAISGFFIVDKNNLKINEKKNRNNGNIKGCK